MASMPGDFEAAGAAIVRETRNAPCQLRAVLRSPIHVIVLTVALGATTILLIIIIVWLAVLHAYTKALDLGLTTLRVAYSAPSELSPCSQDAATQTEATLPAISVIEPEPAIESTQAEQSHIEEVAEHPAPLQSETKASEVDQATEKAVSTNAWDSEQVTLRDNSIRQINKLIQQPQRPGPASELTNKGFNAANLEEARAFMQTATRGGQKSTRKGPKPAAQQNSIPKAKQYSQLAHGPKAWIAPPKKLDTFTTATENSTPRPKATVQKTTVRSRFTEPALTLSNAAAESMHSLPQETQSLATEDRPVSPESTTRVPPSCSDIKTGEFTIAKLKDINPKKHGPGLQCQICLRWSTNVVKLRDNDAIDVCSACQAVVDRIHDANRVIDEPDFYISETTRDQGGSLLPNKQHAASGPSTAKSTSTYTSNGDIIIGHIPETPPGYAGANSAQRTPVKSHSSTGNTRADATLSPLTSQEQLVDLEGDLGGAGSTLTREIPEPLSDSLSSLLDLEDHSTTHEQPMRPVHNNQTRSSSLSAASAPFAPSRSSSGSSGVSPLNLPAPLVEYESRVRYLPDPFVPKHGNALKTVPQIHLTAPGPKPPVFYSQNPRCEPSQPSIAPALGSGEFNTIVFDFGAPTALHALPSTSIAEAYYQDNPAHVRTAIPQHWREDQNADHSQPWGSNYPPTQSYEDIAPPPGLRMPGHLRQALRPGSRSEAIPIVSPAQACGLTDTALRHTHHSTSLSKAIPIVKPPQAVEPKEYYNGKQSIVKSSCDVAAARSSDPDSVPASSEQQQQEQQVQHRSADEPESIETFSKPFEKPDSEHHTDAILADNVPAESNEAHDEDQGPVVKPNNAAKTLRLERKAARDMLNDAWHAREHLRGRLNSGWHIDVAEKLEEATMSYNNKRQDLASLMVSGQLNDEDADMYPKFSIADTSKPKVYVKKRDIAHKPVTEGLLNDDGRSYENAAQPVAKNAAAPPGTTDPTVLKDVYEKTKKAHEVFKLACSTLDAACAQCHGTACDNATASNGTQKMKTTRNWYMKVRARLEDLYGGSLPEEIAWELPKPRTC